MSASELYSGWSASPSGSGNHGSTTQFTAHDAATAPSTWLVTASVVLAMVAVLAGMFACMTMLRDPDDAAEKKGEETEYAGAEPLIYPDETGM